MEVQAEPKHGVVCSCVACGPARETDVGQQSTDARGIVPRGRYWKEERNIALGGCRAAEPDLDSGIRAHPGERAFDHTLNSSFSKFQPHLSELGAPIILVHHTEGGGYLTLTDRQHSPSPAVPSQSISPSPDLLHWNSASPWGVLCSSARSCLCPISSSG